MLTNLTDFIALDCGLHKHDSAMLAYLPKLDSVPQEHPTEWGRILSYDGLVVDGIRDNHRPLKWWLVKNAARAELLTWPEPVWQGMVAELTYDTVAKLQAWLDPKFSGQKMYLRAFSGGPWIDVSSPSVAAATAMAQPKSKGSDG